MSRSAVGHEHGPKGMFSGEPRRLRGEELEKLWEICREINKNWLLFCSDDGQPCEHTLNQLHSAWLEFVQLRANPEHNYQGLSYIAEYESAIDVIAQLKKSDPENAFNLVFSVNAWVPDNPTLDGGNITDDPLWHAKKFVVDEFMTVMIVSGGFKHFGGKNYNGYMAGSRFNRTVSITAPFSYPQRDSQHEEG
jgi:hypothetical protein